MVNLVSHVSRLGAEQVIVVDGGSSDGSVEWLRQHWENRERGQIVIQSAAGRARQMNAGALIAGTDLLLFLHADSRLPDKAKLEILNARENQNLWGRFDIAFDAPLRIRYAMQVIALFINIRSRLTSIATGDQGIFVDSSLFRTIGGYAQIPLMEDVALSKNLKRHSVPHCSKLRISTSARRWEQGGVLRTVLLMWYFRLAYFLGVAPKRLAKQYRQAR